MTRTSLGVADADDAADPARSRTPAGIVAGKRDGAVLDSATCSAKRAAFAHGRTALSPARSNAEAECLGRSHGGLCSKLKVCADGTAAFCGSCQAPARALRLAPCPSPFARQSRT